MSAAFDELLDHPGLWRAADGGGAARSVPSGNALLDAWLPNGGWPAAALTELLVERQAIGTFDLLVPLLAGLTGDGQEVALVAPPFVPYAPALAARGVDLERVLVVQPRLAAEGFWAAEQVLRSGAFAALLAWCTDTPGMRVLRRLQLAAEQGGGTAFLLRHWPGAAETPVAPEASPAVLRLRLSACGGRVRAAARAGSDPRLLLHVVKCRGRAPRAPLAL